MLDVERGRTLVCELHAYLMNGCNALLTARQHNNTNIVAFGARIIGIETAKDIVDAWLSGEYQGGRHQVRIDMIDKIQKTQRLAAAEE